MLTVVLTSGEVNDRSDVYHGDNHFEYFRGGETSSFFDRVSGLASQKAIQWDVLGLTGRPARTGLLKSRLPHITSLKFV